MKKMSKKIQNDDFYDDKKSKEREKKETKARKDIRKAKEGE